MVPWYAIQSKAWKEELLAEQLRLRGVEIYYPYLRVKPVNPRSHKTKPYFPGYLFVQLDLVKTDLASIRWLPGAIGLVSFDGEPATVPETLVWTIRKRVDEINANGDQHLESWQRGDVVTIQDGPLAGYEAIFDRRLSGPDRVRVLLNLMADRRIPVDLSAGQIKLKNRR